MPFPSYATCRCGDVYVASHKYDRACDDCAAKRRATDLERDAAAARRRAAYRALCAQPAAPYVPDIDPDQLAELTRRIIRVY